MCLAVPIFLTRVSKVLGNDFLIKESEENDLIKQYLETPKRGQFQNPLFSLTIQPVKINNPGVVNDKM